MNVHPCACDGVYVCVCEFVCVGVRLYDSVCTCACVHVCVCAHVFVGLFMRECVHVSVRV